MKIIVLEFNGEKTTEKHRKFKTEDVLLTCESNSTVLMALINVSTTNVIFNFTVSLLYNVYIYQCIYPSNNSLLDACAYF